MNIVISILTIYAFFSLFGSLVSLIGRRKFLKSFTNEQEIESDLHLLQMSLYIMHPNQTGDSKSLEKNADEIKEILSVIRKIKENKTLGLEEIKCIEKVKHKLKIRLGDLIRLDSAYIFINLVILLLIFYLF